VPASPTAAVELHRLGAAAARLGFTYRHVRRLVARGELAGTVVKQSARGPGGPTWSVDEANAAFPSLIGGLLYGVWGAKSLFTARDHLQADPSADAPRG